MVDDADTLGTSEEPPADPGHTAPRPHRAKHTRRHRVRLAVFILGGLLAVGLVADLIATSGKVHPRVAAGGIDVGGDTLDEARTALSQEAARLSGSELTYRSGESALPMTPEALGWRPDPEATADAAFAVGRGGPMSWIFGRPSAWIFGKQVPWVDTWDRKKLRTTVASWAEAVSLPIQEGNVTIQKGEVVATEPKAGTRVDLEELVQRTEHALTDGSTSVDLPIVTAEPVSVASAVAVARKQAEAVISAPIRVRLGPSTIVFTPQELADLYTTTVNEDDASTPQPVAGFDPELVDELLDPYRSEVEKAPVNATVTGQGKRDIEITPSKTGKVISSDIAGPALFRIATSSNRAGKVPLTIAEPDVTTEMLEAIGVKTRISSFTGYYPSDEARVENIHLGADVLDGAVVQPGETFSMNERLGERTLEKGYVAAPAIFEGTIVDQVGGGISQLTTTLYNAAFFAGFPIDEHQAHSFYFTRYPMGREATLGWKEPDLKFTNDLDTPVVIDTTYTETSITVSVYGKEITRKVTATTPQITEKDKDYYTVAITRQIEDLDGKVLDREVVLTRYRKELEPTPTPTPSP